MNECDKIREKLYKSNLSGSLSSFLNPTTRPPPYEHDLEQIIKMYLELLHVCKKMEPEEKNYIIEKFANYKNNLFSEDLRKKFQKLVEKKLIEVFVEKSMVPKSKNIKAMYSVTKKLPEPMQDLIRGYLFGKRKNKTSRRKTSRRKRRSLKRGKRYSRQPSRLKKTPK